MSDIIKERYAQVFGLPPGQIRFFTELTEPQVELVRRYFTAGLVGVENYVFAVRRDGGLVMRREKRRPLLERGT